jgi:hypothetical protein
MDKSLENDLRDLPFHERLAIAAESQPILHTNQQGRTAMPITQKDRDDLAAYRARPRPNLMQAKANDPRVAELAKIINNATGRNAVERCNSVLCEKKPGHSALTLDMQIAAASAALESIKAGKLPDGYPDLPPAPEPTVQSMVAAFNASPGRNSVEKAHALLCSRSAAFAGKPLVDRIRLSGEFVRTLAAGRVPQGIV